MEDSEYFLYLIIVYVQFFIFIALISILGAFIFYIINSKLVKKSDLTVLEFIIISSGMGISIFLFYAFIIDL